MGVCGEPCVCQISVTTVASALSERAGVFLPARCLIGSGRPNLRGADGSAAVAARAWSPIRRVRGARHVTLEGDILAPLASDFPCSSAQGCAGLEYAAWGGRLPLHPGDQQQGGEVSPLKREAAGCEGGVKKSTDDTSYAESVKPVNRSYHQDKADVAEFIHSHTCTWKRSNI